MESVLEVRRMSPRAISMDLSLQGKIMAVIQFKGHGLEKVKRKKKFFDALASELLLRNDNCFAMGDFNGYFETLANRYDRV